ncbi:MAG: hypothetical protein QW445_07485 [Candidatus Bathyarchaeia archaeon]
MTCQCKNCTCTNGNGALYQCLDRHNIQSEDPKELIKKIEEILSKTQDTLENLLDKQKQSDVKTRIKMFQEWLINNVRDAEKTNLLAAPALFAVLERFRELFKNELQ